MFSKFVPINKNILLEVMEKEDKTSGGIIIPDQAQEKNLVAKVVHPGASTQLQKDDLVYYKKYMGTALNDKLLVVKEEEILGKL